MNLFTSEFSHQFINSFFWTCIHSLWQGLLLVIIGYFLVDVLKKQSATIRYNLLFALLSVFALSFLVTFYFQVESIKKIETTQVAITPFQEPLLCTPQYIAKGNGPIESVTNFFNGNSFTLTLLWFLIFLYKIAKIAYHLKSIEHLINKHSANATSEWNDTVARLSRQLGILKQVTLRVSQKVTSPAVVGFWRSIIVVPVGLLSSLPYEQVEAILLHELAHIKRNDYLFNFFQLFIEAIFYFNPGVLLLSRLIRIERENCCDDIAVKRTSNPHSLANALVACEEFRTTQLSLSLGITGGCRQTLFSRVKRLLAKEETMIVKTAVVSKSILLILPLAFSMFLIQSFRFTGKTSASETNLSDTTIVTSGINYYKTGVVGPGTSIKKQVEVKGAVIDIFVLENDGTVYQIEKQNDQITNVIINGIAQSQNVIKRDWVRLTELVNRVFERKAENDLWMEVQEGQKELPIEALSVPYNKNNEGMLTDGITDRYFGDSYEIRIQNGRLKELYYEGKRIPHDKLAAYEIVVEGIVSKVDARLKRAQ